MTKVEWGAGEAPPPEGRDVPFVWLLSGALGLLFGAFAATAALVSAAAQTVLGEPPYGSHAWGVLGFGVCGVLAVWVGWRAYRRTDAGSPHLAALAKLVPVLLGIGAALGLAAAFKIAVSEVNAAELIDAGTCGHFGGPLAPRDLSACIEAAQDCRRSPKTTRPTMLRGVTDAKVPEGLTLPPTTEGRIRVMCVYERRHEFVR